jgi:hypothetical protein
MVWFLAFTRMRDDGVSAAAVVASTDSQSPGSELGVSEKPPCQMFLVVVARCRRQIGGKSCFVLSGVSGLRAAGQSFRCPARGARP